MALKDCRFPLMASRSNTSRFSRAPAANYAKEMLEYDGQEDVGEGRVVESLGHVSVENRWCVFVPTGSLPPARAKHAALSIGRRMFVLGGTSADGILDDVQVFHAERGVWLQLGCGSIPSLYSPSKTIPADARGPRCVGHCLAFWETKLLVIGGRIEPKSSKLKAYALDLQSQSWSILAPKGEVPSGRTGQSIVQVSSALILFGGEDMKGQMLNDLFILDLKTLVWVPVKTTGSKPSPRRGHSAVCYTERYMLVFGGKAHGNYYNDIYFLDLQSMEWTREKPKGTAPSCRAGHRGAMVGSKWYIVGGEFRGSECLETLSFDCESRSWSTVTTVQPGTPLANDGLSIVKVRNKGKTFLLAFGGHGAILSNQIFVMMVPSNNKISPPNRKRDEADHDDFSTSSLPFSFTSGSLRTIQSMLVSSGIDQHMPPPPPAPETNAQSISLEMKAEVEEESVSSNVMRGIEVQQKYLRYRESISGGSERELIEMCGNPSEVLRSSELEEMEKALRRAVEEKEEGHRKLEDAEKVIEGLKREVEALVDSRIEGDKKLRAARKEVEKLRVSLEVEKVVEGENVGGGVVNGGGGDEAAVVSELRRQLRESQQQIVLSVRKQALAERKLLGALKENRELRKKLLHVKEEDKSGESSELAI